MILLRRPDPDEPEDTRPFEEQLLEAMLRPLSNHPYAERGEFPSGTDMDTVGLWLSGYKIENADVNEEYL